MRRQLPRGERRFGRGRQHADVVHLQRPLDRFAPEVHQEPSPLVFEPAFHVKNGAYLLHREVVLGCFADHGVVSAQAEKQSIKSQDAGLRLELALVPIQTRLGERRLGLRIGNLAGTAHLKLHEAGEFLASSRGDGFSQFRLVIGEKEKRARRAPFLAHEQEGGGRQK